MLIIDKELFVGKGFHRECYQHPQDHTKCLKITFKQPKKGGKKGVAKALKREVDQYKILNKRITDWSMLSNYYGEQETNLGKCSVFELIRDDNGEVSRSLEQYLLEPKLTETELIQIKQCIPLLKAYLIKNNIITQKILARNIVFQRSSTPLLVIIDDIGNSDFLPLANYVKTVGEKKINRIFSRFIKHLKNTYITERSPKQVNEMLRSL